jgi:uncharacterized repeat protein (TIGR02543 family)
MRKKSSLILSLAIIFSVLLTSISYADVTSNYQNPLMRGADPTITRAADGFYYSCFAVDNDIYLKKAETILGVGTAKSRLVWDKPADFGYVWGPYIYRLQGKWYIYFTSGPENDFGWGHPSSYVLENTSPDPFEGTWELKGMSSNADADGRPTEKAGLLNTQGYGLACGVVTMGGKTYFTYTKYFYYPDDTDSTKMKFEECPTIVEMKDPWTLQGTEGTLARPVYEWEKNGDSINEGAAVVERNGKVYFGYSVSSFMNDNYGVGISTATSDDILLEESSWTKNPEPAMVKSPENSSFGPGSPLFVKSEDGSEDWLIYHGGPVGGQTGSNRWVRSQRINWNDDDSINLGIPSNPGTILDRPSGEEKSETYEAEDAAFGGVTRTILSDSSKSSGSGVMKYNNSSNGYVEFTVDANMAGSYSLNFRYNNSTGNNIPMNLQVNQNGTSELSFSPNGSNITNYDLLRVDNVQLNVGRNKIRISSSTANGLVLDALIIKRSILYEAENAALSGGAGIENSHTGFSGTGFVGGMDTVGSAAEFKVNAPYAGSYSINLRYSNGSDNIDKTMSMYVNGMKIRKIDLFSFGDWNRWSDRYDNVDLKTGENTITYKYDSGDGGNVNLDSINVTEATTRHYEAEDAVLTGNAIKKDTEHTGYTGTGYVAGLWEAGSVDFSVNVENAASYDVKLKYALGFAEGRTISLYLNGSKVKQISIKGSGGWATWSEHLETLSLNKGNNTISFKRDSDDTGDINIDNIHLNKRTPWKYQAEEATMVGGAHKSDDHLWYEGTGFVGGFESAYVSPTQYEGIKFKVNVPNTASYTTTLRYCAGSGPRTISIYVNGTKLKQLTLPGTAGWDAWGEYTETVDLKAGNNVIEYRRDAADNGGFNIDSITIDKDSGGSTDLKNRGIVSGTVYSIRAKHSGKSLDVAGYSSNAGALVNQWTYLANNNQKWEFVDIGNGYYKIVSAHSGKVLDVVNNANKDICQATATGTDSQQWKLEKVGGYYKIINKYYETVLDVSGESKNNGAGVHLWAYVDKANQLWKIEIPSSYEMFIPVTGITSVPDTAGARKALMLDGDVLPYNASNQTKVWSVKDAGITGATISNNTLTTTEAGIAVVTVTILDGTAEGNTYTQDFIITVTPNQTPTAKALVSAQTMTIGKSLSFTAADIAEDGDNDTLMITEIKTAPDPIVVTSVLSNGTVTVSGLATGTTTAIVTVSDGRGGMVDITVPVEVTGADINPSSANYDLNAPGDVSTTITWNDASIITDVVYGETHITATPDTYVVTGSALTIKSDYLSTLGLVNGNKAEFAISFDKGNPVTFTVNIVDSAIPSHGITVENDGRGTASANVTSAAIGVEIELTATPNDGYHFKEWQVTSPLELIINGNIFTMPNEAVTVKAIFEENPVVGYTLTINGSYASGSGAGSYPKGATVTINAGSRSNYTFIGWSSNDGVTFANINSPNTTFTMPTKNVNVTASWSYNGGPSTPSTPVTEVPTVTTPSTSYNGSSVISTTTIEAKSDVNGIATATVTESQITEAVTKAVAEAAKNAAGTNAIVEIKVNTVADAKSVETTMPAKAISALINNKIDAIIITSPIATITFDDKALSTISKETETDVKVTATKLDSSMLSEETKQKIGDRPVFTFSVTSGSKTISDFGGGNATVVVPYTLKSGEDKNAIVIYYINAEGKAEIVKNCTYNTATGKITFKTTHFSQYAIGYNKVEFSDVVANAWYSNAVGYVAARDITAGTGDNKFSPADKLTRGQFLVMVMKAYGQKPDENAIDNFTDAGNTYYTGYLAAAKRLGITAGIGDNKYAPQNQITRQEMFTLLYNTLKLIGQLPTGNNGKAVTDFDDVGNVAPWAKDAVTVFVNAGIITGSDNKLTPVATTNRAQMAQVLYNLLFK